MHQLIQRASEFLRGTAQEVIQRRMKEDGDARQLRGFTAAASISLRLVQSDLDALKERMKNPGLNKTEQALYVHLEELQAKINAGFDGYWEGSGYDWHPSKPLVKTVRMERPLKPEAD